MSIERIESGPSHTSAQHGVRLSDRQAQADFETYERFKDACAELPATAVIPWSPTRTDWDAPYITGDMRPIRHYQLHEVMSDALDYPSGPGMDEAMSIILHAAKSKDEWIAKPARELIQRMATTWARYNTPEVDDDL